MAEKLFEPIPIAYQGSLADQHLVDAQQFGRSLIGVSKLANSICHELFFETITHDPRSYQIRFCVLPSRENGLLQEIVAVVNSGQLAVFTPALLKLGKVLVETIIKAIVNQVLHKPSEVSKALDTIQQMAQRNADFQRQVLRGQMRDKKWLQGMVENLARENRAPLREVPDPVGRTVRLMKIGDTKAIGPLEIDEPIAEVLRSRGQMEVGETQEYDVKLVGVFKTNGACRVKLPGGAGQIVSGKITDPKLTELGNVYTTALNEDAVLHVSAKSTSKDGKLHKLYISDATIRREGGRPHRVLGPRRS